MSDVKGSVIVTGAASGIGAACAAVLAEQGERVVMSDIVEPDRLPDGDVSWCTADLTEDDGRGALLRRAGSVKGIVHSAGILRTADPATFPADTWNQVIEVNLTATFRLVQASIGHLTDSASIVLMSSVSAKWAATPESIAYAASKAAILSITRSFATYFAPRGIRINALCPGIIDTPMQRRLLRDVAETRGITEDELEAERNRTIPLGRMGAPVEVADVAAFLISDKASYMTGQSINVTGGMVTH